MVKISKDKKTEEISKEILTKKWSDWIDYWAVDFDFADRKEIIKVIENDEEKKFGPATIFLTTNGRVSAPRRIEILISLLPQRWQQKASIK